MSDNPGKRRIIVTRPEDLLRPVTRREVLRVAALGGTALLVPGLLAACKDDPAPLAPEKPAPKPATTAMTVGDNFMGEIKLITWNFAPRGWALCNGQLLPINQNQALFSLLGTTFGGNGQTNFALPDLRSRTPIHMGQGFALGQRGGEEFHTLSVNELPQHLHFMQASTVNADTPTAAGNYLGSANNLYASDVLVEPDTLATAAGVRAARALPDTVAAPAMAYAAPSALTSLHPSTISAVGGGQAHENRQPFLVMNFIIALTGIFPSQT